MPPLPASEPGVLTKWMAQVPDQTLLSLLSLPGTHNSAAWHVSFPSVQCQGASITQQLIHGIRFFDIRVARPFLGMCGEPQDLQVIHGAFPVKIPYPEKLYDVLNDILAFLQDNPSETAIVSIKQEGNDKWDNDNDEFANLIWNKYIAPYEDKWYLGGDIPRLGAVRGKALLFRRFGVKSDQLKAHFGFEASWWTYNSPEDDRGKFVVQDWSEVNEPADFTTKIGYVNQHIERAIQYNATSDATQDHGAKLFINFCSGSNFFNPQCWPQGVSRAVSDGINGMGKSCGIVIVDYAETGDWGLIRQIVHSNLSGAAQ